MDLRSLGRSQDRHLGALRSSDRAVVLTRLARAECLLELAKLSSVRIDLASYAELVVGIVTQFFPSKTCSVSIEVAGVPTISVTHGNLDTSPPPACRYPLAIKKEPVGELIVVPNDGHLDAREFVSEIANQVSYSLGALVEAERLRRQAAVAQTMHLVQLLGDQPNVSDLNELVQALASLPNAIGARLEITHSTIGGALSLTSGAPPFERPEQVPVPGGSVGVALRWASSAGIEDTKSLGEVLDMLASALGKSEERRLLRDEAETDPLTNIGNRRRAIRSLAAAIALAEGSRRTLGVVYLDLDYFKRVNDAFGHDVGDRTLVNFAEHLVRTVRSYDTVARIGGEEFLIICPGLDEQSAASLARRILKTTPSACADVLPPGWIQTASAGFACYPAAGTDTDSLLQAADRALYAAKRAGRNQARAASEPPLLPAS